MSPESSKKGLIFFGNIVILWKNELIRCLIFGQMFTQLKPIPYNEYRDILLLSFDCRVGSHHKIIGSHHCLLQLIHSYMLTAFASMAAIQHDVMMAWFPCHEKNIDDELNFCNV